MIEMRFTKIFFNVLEVLFYLLEYLFRYKLSYLANYKTFYRIKILFNKIIHPSRELRDVMIECFIELLDFTAQEELFKKKIIIELQNIINEIKISMNDDEMKTFIMDDDDLDDDD